MQPRSHSPKPSSENSALHPANTAAIPTRDLDSISPLAPTLTKTRTVTGPPLSPSAVRGNLYPAQPRPAPADGKPDSAICFRVGTQGTPTVLTVRSGYGLARWPRWADRNEPPAGWARELQRRDGSDVTLDDLR